MAGPDTGAGSGAGPVAATGSGVGPVAEALLAFERVAVVAEAARVREAGVRAEEQTGSLVAALDQAGAAAAGAGAESGAGPPGGVLSGAALTECAALLARRAREAAVETELIAERMVSAADLLVGADEEVARSVAGAAG